MTARNLADAARLLTSRGMQELLDAAVDTTLADAGVTASMIYIAQRGGWLRLAAVNGYEREEADAYRWIPPDSPYPVAVALREHRPAHQPMEQLSGVADGRQADAVSFTAFPFLVGDDCPGVLLLELPGRAPLAPAAEASVEALVTVCAPHVSALARGDGGGPGTARSPAGAPVLVDERAGRLDLALTSADLGTFEWHIRSGTVLWDERLCRLFGLDDPQSFDGSIDTFLQLVHREDRERVSAALVTSFDSGHFEAVYRIERPDGAVRWIDARGRVRYDGSRRPLTMSGVARDCTADQERRQLNAMITDTFASALRVQDVLDGMVTAILPLLHCSALAIHLGQRDDLVLAGAEGYPPDALKRLEAAGRGGRRSPMSEALRAGSLLLIEDLDQYREAFPDSALRPAPGHRAWAVLPLATANGPVGSCVMSYPEPHRFSGEERNQLRGLVGALAQCLARAALFEQRRRQMTELQAMMLPRRLSTGPGVDVAVRYRPATEGLDVGGDFYDTIPLPGRGTGVVIGDVQGHNAHAAAVMGQVRTALRAFATSQPHPAHVMDQTNRMLCDLDTDLFATACYAHIDPARDRATVVRAGHPNPLTVAADGRVAETAAQGGPPLGIDRRHAYHAEETALHRGQALLLYTDGLIERRDDDYDHVVAELVGSVERTATDLIRHGATVPDVLELLADHVTARPPAGPVQDDIAVLLVGHAG